MIFSFLAQFLKRRNLAQAHSTGANEQHYLEIAPTALVWIQAALQWIIPNKNIHNVNTSKIPVCSMDTIKALTMYWMYTEY